MPNELFKIEDKMLFLLSLLVFMYFDELGGKFLSMTLNISTIYPFFWQ